jgi:hypothetical protein
MQKWEYDTFTLTGVERDPAETMGNPEEDRKIKEWLDTLGKLGWECYHLSFHNYSYSTDSKMTVKYAQNIKGYFKRKVVEPIKKESCNLCETDPEMKKIVFEWKTPSCIPNHGYLGYDKKSGERVDVVCVYRKKEG